MLVTLCKVGEMSFSVLGSNDFHVEAENENLPLRQNLKYDLKLSLCRLTELIKKNCTKRSAARVPRLFCHNSSNHNIDS